MNLIFWILYAIIMLAGYHIVAFFCPGFDPWSWYGGCFTALVGLVVLDMKNYILHYTPMAMIYMFIFCIVTYLIIIIYAKRLEERI